MIKKTNNSIVVFFLGPPIGHCVMGIIVNTQRQSNLLANSKLLLEAGKMPSITFHIHHQSFPVIFMITDIPLSQNENSTLVTALIKNTSGVVLYEARRRAVFGCDNECTTVLLRVAEDSKNMLYLL